MEAEVSEQVGVEKVSGRGREEGARPIIESRNDCRGLTRHVKRAFITETDAAEKFSLAPIIPANGNQLLVKVPHIWGEKWANVEGP